VFNFLKGFLLADKKQRFLEDNRDLFSDEPITDDAKSLPPSPPPFKQQIALNNQQSFLYSGHASPLMQHSNIYSTPQFNDNFGACSQQNMLSYNYMNPHMHC
jgi:hypothetical protein